MQVAEVVVPIAGVVTNIIVAPWIAWTYLRSEPRRPSSGERIAAGLIVLVNLIWPLWIGLEIAYWPPDIFDVSVMGLALMTAVLVLSISFSTRPVGLSAS